MYKKAGIVGGIILIVLALSIYGVTNYLQSKKNSQPSQEWDTIGQEQNYIPPVEEQVPYQPQEQDQIPVVNEPTTPRPVNEPKQVFSTVSLESLGNPIDFQQEIMVVSKKKLVLLDSDTSSNENKQLYYALELLTSENKVLTNFVSESAYNSVSVGTKLQVEYKVYKNDHGVKFPVIVSATQVQ